MSGRALRRLPVLALARYIGIGSASTNLAISLDQSIAPTTKETNGPGAWNGVNGSNTSGTGKRGADVEVWLEGMEKVILERGAEHEKLI